MTIESKAASNEDRTSPEDAELRASWTALSELIESAIPRGDNDALLKNLRKSLDVERRTSRPLARNRWLEPLAVVAAIAGVIVLAMILSRSEVPAPNPTGVPNAVNLAWEDGLDAIVAVIEEEAVSWSSSPSVALEFDAIQQEIDEFKESIESERL